MTSATRIKMLGVELVLDPEIAQWRAASRKDENENIMTQAVVSLANAYAPFGGLSPSTPDRVGAFIAPLRDRFGAVVLEIIGTPVTFAMTGMEN